MLKKKNQAYHNAILQTAREEVKSLYGVINKLLPAG